MQKMLRKLKMDGKKIEKNGENKGKEIDRKEKNWKMK
jgi:hypothetical protein